jgi:hypothetical protein
MIQSLSEVKKRVVNAKEHQNLSHLEREAILVGIEEPMNTDQMYTMPLVLGASALERARDDLISVIRYAQRQSQSEQERFVRYLPMIVEANSLLSQLSVRAVQEVGSAFNLARNAGIVKGEQIMHYTGLVSLNYEQAHIAARVQEGRKCNSRGIVSCNSHGVDQDVAAILLPSGETLKSPGSDKNSDMETELGHAMSRIVPSLMFVEYKKFTEVAGALEAMAKDFSGNHSDAAQLCRSSARMLKAVYESSRVLYKTLPPKPIAL